MRTANIILTWAIGLVWLINGLACKVLNLVPRHQEIVARILGEEHAMLFTRLIGGSEILMFIWIVSRIQPRWCALAQMGIVAAMNTLEFFLVPDILLFGKLNALFAIIFIGAVGFNEFVLRKNA